ncbi:ROK family protein [Dysosmobacter sp. Sow4_B12]|uniref:ROK family protein n=1 Tax=Dysosmobacter sp. Sow4_B12 TaxID=3438777 RepID=UPI003F9106BD
MLYIGIDVGGTNLKAGLVDETGKILAVERCPLNFQGPEQFAEDVARLAASAAGKGGVAPESLAYVGMGLPGAVSGGDILFTTNIPMKDVPIERLFRRHLDLPLLLGNDADCAAVGEFFCGAGRGTRDFAVVTLGTGIGCGLLLGGKLHGGPASSEAGHLVICHGGELCNCGRRGCWERYASATALIQQTKAAMAAHPESLLHAIAAENGGVVEGRTAFQAAQAGDETALAVCRQYVEYLADGTISLINILRPEAVAIGGGVAAAPEHLLLEPLREIVARESFSSHGGITTRVLRAELGNDAGIIGAAMLGRAI